MENWVFKVVVLVSADAEWAAVREIFAGLTIQRSPFGEWLVVQPSEYEQNPPDVPLVFFQGGWGKIAAAASCQYAIDRWQPDLLVNLGTCGGFEGHIDRGEVILVEKTVVYDIQEQMADPQEVAAYYTTHFDLTWLGEALPHPVRRTLLVSADRDLLAQDIPGLVERYGAVAGDWESGAIAWVCARNRIRLLILRGVTDLVGAGGGDAYGNHAFFVEEARRVMNGLILQLPDWLEAGRRK